MNRILLKTLVLLISNIAFAQDSVVITRQIDSLNQLQGKFSDLEKFDSAYVYVQKALALAMAELPENHLTTAKLLHSKAFIELQLQYLDEAELNFKRSLLMKEQLHLTNTTTYCSSLNNLANVYITRKDMQLAEQFYLEAKTCFEKTGDTTNIQYGHVLNNLGIVCRETGRYYEAEKYLLEAVRVKTHAANASEIDLVFTANTYTMLGDIYARLGDYPRMEKANAQRCALLLSEPKVKELPYYWRRDNLGNYFMDRGDWEKALQYFEEAVYGKRMFLGDHDVNLAGSLLNLANASSAVGRFQDANNALLEAYAIYAQDSIKYSLHQSWVLNNLGLSQMGLHHPEQAISYTRRSLKKKEEAEGIDNNDWNGTYINLMDFLISEGEYDSTEINLLERLHYYQSHLPEFKSSQLECLSLLADLYNRKKETVKAKFMIEALLADDLLSIENFSQFNIPSIISSYLGKTGKNIDRYLSLYLFDQQLDSSYTATCYNLALYYKGFLLGAMETLRKSIHESPGFNKIADNIRYLDYQLNDLYASKSPNQDEIARLESEKKNAETDFALTLPKFTTESKIINWKNVQASLLPNEMAIEFVKYSVNHWGRLDSFMYAALLVRPGDFAPIYVPLFEEEDLIFLLPHNQHNSLESTQTNYSHCAMDSACKSLYPLIWKPLEAYIKGFATIYYAPSGLLFTINLGAIENPDGVLQSDLYNLVRLGSTREIYQHEETTYDSTNCLLIGGLIYEMDTTSMADTTEYHTLLADVMDDHSDMSLADPALRGSDWKYLEGTQDEVESISKLMFHQRKVTTTLTGSGAREETFKQKVNNSPSNRSPWIIHLSTHGYFFPDIKLDNSALSNSTEPVFKIADHPMIRSGLILAGGNYAWTHGHPFKPGMEDGILTAYEISQMDLSNTELVVLSACETGLGDIKGNEGVYGLQRAFKIAGVKNLIMSLWQVPDAATAELMTSFYKHWLEDKMAIRDALHTAQKEMREEGWEVYDWAGFILVE